MLLRSSILKLPEYLFWDTDYNKVDVNKNDLAIIARVFDYGSWDDVMEVVAFYGEKKVIKYLKLSSYLKPRSVSLACSLFNLNPTDFKCYTKRQFHHGF